VKERYLKLLCCWLEDGGRDSESRRVGSFWKLEETGNDSLQRLQKEGSPADLFWLFQSSELLR
jgi:hypothetical protein